MKPGWVGVYLGVRGSARWWNWAISPMVGCSDIETIVSVPPIALNYEAVMSKEVGLLVSSLDIEVQQTFYSRIWHRE